jgi:hypothetical protein
MRTWRFLAVAALLLLTAAVLGLPAGVRAIPPPNCLFVGQECVSCGSGCQELCNDYACDDGSQRMNCGSCNCIQECIPD